MNAWNHVFVGEHATLFEIARSRGFDVTAGALGVDYSGVLVLVTCDQLLRNPLDSLAQSLRTTHPIPLLVDGR